MEIETRQRIKYLIEHGGLWEQARDDNTRMHRIILAGLVLSIGLQVVEILFTHLLH